MLRLMNNYCTVPRLYKVLYKIEFDCQDTELGTCGFLK